MSAFGHIYRLYWAAAAAEGTLNTRTVTDVLDVLDQRRSTQEHGQMEGAGARELLVLFRDHDLEDRVTLVDFKRMLLELRSYDQTGIVDDRRSLQEHSLRDTVSLIEQLVLLREHRLLDRIDEIDSVVQTIFRAVFTILLTDTVGLNDVIVKLREHRHLDEAGRLAEAIQAAQEHRTTDRVDLVETVRADYLRVVLILATDTVGLLDRLVLLQQHRQEESTTIRDATRAETTHVLSDAVRLVDSLLAAVLRLLTITETVVLVEGQRAEFTKALADTVALQETLRIFRHHLLVDPLRLNDTVTAQYISSVAAVARSLSKVLLGLTVQYRSIRVGTENYRGIRIDLGEWNE